jgi:hypothetical protein
MAIPTELTAIGPPQAFVDDEWQRVFFVQRSRAPTYFVD